MCSPTRVSPWKVGAHISGGHVDERRRCCCMAQLRKPVGSLRVGRWAARCARLLSCRNWGGGRSILVQSTVLKCSGHPSAAGKQPLPLARRHRRAPCKAIQAASTAHQRRTVQLMAKASWMWGQKRMSAAAWMTTPPARSGGSWRSSSRSPSTSRTACSRRRPAAACAARAADSSCEASSWALLCCAPPLAADQHTHCLRFRAAQEVLQHEAADEARAACEEHSHASKSVDYRPRLHAECGRQRVAGERQGRGRRESAEAGGSCLGNPRVDGGPPHRTFAGRPATRFLFDCAPRSVPHTHSTCALQLGSRLPGRSAVVARETTRRQAPPPSCALSGFELTSLSRCEIRGLRGLGPPAPPPTASRHRQGR